MENAAEDCVYYSIRRTGGIRSLRRIAGLGEILTKLGKRGYSPDMIIGTMEDPILIVNSELTPGDYELFRSANCNLEQFDYMKEIDSYI